MSNQEEEARAAWVHIYLLHPACPTCGHKPDGSSLSNPTYNLTPIFDAALTGGPLPNPNVSEAYVVLLGSKTDRPRGLRLLNGSKASDTIVILEKALKRMRNPEEREKFLALQPSNGWGTLDGAIGIMEELLRAASTYPESEWKIH
jgi:hypothetical protein